MEGEDVSSYPCETGVAPYPVINRLSVGHNESLPGDGPILRQHGHYDVGHTRCQVCTNESRAHNKSGSSVDRLGGVPGRTATSTIRVDRRLVCGRVTAGGILCTSRKCRGCMRKSPNSGNFRSDRTVVHVRTNSSRIAFADYPANSASADVRDTRRTCALLH